MDKIAENIKKIIIDFINALGKNNFHIQKVFLFGSYANGTNNDNSDIDVALIFDEYISDRFDTQVELMKLRRNIDLRIEPHPFDNSSFNLNNPFVYEIVHSGIEIDCHH